MTEPTILRMYPHSMPLPCFKCGKEFDWAAPGISHKASGQPAKGVMCSTSGNYGSQVFDSVGRDALYFNICDQCLVEGKHNLIWMETRPSPPRYEYRVSGDWAPTGFDPDAE